MGGKSEDFFCGFGRKKGEEQQNGFLFQENMMYWLNQHIQLIRTFLLGETN